MPKLSTILFSVGKTINLAKPNSYHIPRKPPLNTLIFEKLPECGQKVTCGVKIQPSSKPVRVCTREAMQSFYCPPPPCDCKVKPPPLTFFQKLGWLCKQLIKAGIVGGIVYYTYKEGLWSDPLRSSCLLGKFFEYCPPEEEPFINMYSTLDPPRIKAEEPCTPFIPRIEVVLYQLGLLWNSLIISLFWMVLEGPMWVLNFFYPSPETIEQQKSGKKTCPV